MSYVDKTTEQIDPEARTYGHVNPESARYRHLCADALAKQTVPYAIAPGQAVVVNRGGDRSVILEPYEEIKLSDMADPTLHPKDAMQRLVDRGLVLAKGDK